MNRHIVLTLGRSGSNTLCDMLNQHPEVLNFGEVLGEWNQIRKVQRRLRLYRKSDTAYLDRVLLDPKFARFANMYRSTDKRRKNQPEAVKVFRNIETYGVKDFALNFERYGLRQYLKDRPQIKVIGLIRANVADRLVSTLMLGNTGVVAVRDDTADTDIQLHVEPPEFLRLLKAIDRENTLLSNMLNEIEADRLMVISYDDLFRDNDTRQKIMDDCFRFLDVHPIETRTRMKKILKKPISELIENYGDCIESIRGSQFEVYFAEDIEA
ncbi:hypothetical protein PEL8287_03782 [Roseovarius litorisediminis]|uniref:Sulfotransferase family protein n=1 Tax=Roseovarius litorisediminis TaxID=1312363 RepID=A0A1Y5TU50_9RHOB|nr:sulfotransferase [Roseovarius litorisediminis]SLN68135.1 hypothetical protein PEL8287_03782 [Roseovarius litorisediminis]